VKNLIFLAFIIFSSAALATSGEHHEEGIPVKLITYQFINVGLIAIGLIYFLREGIKKTFLERRAGYLVAAEKAETARKLAENERSNMEHRLTNLEETAAERIARARAEAADLKKQLIQEAEALSQRLKVESEQSAKAEIAKAKKEIREEIIRQAMEMTRTHIEKQVSPEDHVRLQNNFIQNIQVGQK
jgi:F-type H+-transporting ATPase subunit b